MGQEGDTSCSSQLQNVNFYVFLILIYTSYANTANAASMPLAVPTDILVRGLLFQYRNTKIQHSFATVITNRDTPPDPLNRKHQKDFATPLNKL